jgi:hypothetical protein
LSTSTVKAHKGLIEAYRKSKQTAGVNLTLTFYTNYLTNLKKKGLIRKIVKLSGKHKNKPGRGEAERSKCFNLQIIKVK